MSKLTTALWFLKKPQYIPQIFQILKRKRNNSLEHSREEATEWCISNRLSESDAIKKLTNITEYKGLNELFPDELAGAQNAEKKCPVKMGGAGATTFIYHLVKFTGSQKIIETGVAYGWSSLAILLAIKDSTGARLISNDMPYVNMGNDDFVGCVIPEKLKEKWELQRLPDIKGIPLALKKFKNTIGFCHYDSDKSYTGRMWASPILWEALKKGGFFVSDDINDNLAFKKFSESVNRLPVIIEHEGKYVGVIVK